MESSRIFLGFFGPLLWFLPLVSLVLYLIWKSDKPKVANGIGQFTLIGLAVGVGLAVIIAIIVSAVCDNRVDDCV